MTTVEQTLRPATVDDADDIARVWRAAWLDGHAGHVPAELVAARDPEYFADRSHAWAGSTTLATAADGRLLGLVIVVGDELVQLAVDRRARRLGVGTRLLTAAETAIAARARQAWLAVAPGNSRAQALYARNGWRDAGEMTYAAPTRSGSTVPVPVRRYVKDLR
jgi:ribosomal protein S18 acetylase RimI-like enzyme